MRDLWTKTKSPFELARDLVGKTSIADLPIGIEDIATHLGISKIEPAEMRASGRLVETKEGLLCIQYKTGDPDVRRRFTIAHELGHMLIAQASGTDIHEFYRGKTAMNNEERTSNLLAEELLMPRHLMATTVEQHIGDGYLPNWQFLRNLAYRFSVSLSSIALRFLSLPNIRCIFLVVYPDRRRSNGLVCCNPARSHSGGISMRHPPPFEANRIWQESGRTNIHKIPVVTHQGQVEMHCEGLLRRVTDVQQQSHREYWVIGWLPTTQEKINSTSSTQVRDTAGFLLRDETALK